jgi:hypothetical protein
MNIETGHLYFLKEDFFIKISDKYVKKDHETTQRPHYYALKDPKTSLYWLVPCSTQADKYEKIIKAKQAKNKPTDSIKIIKIQDKKNALLFQDMFPITANYILKPYIRGGQLVRIADDKVLKELENNAYKIIKLLRRGVKFTPTSPDVKKIEELMLSELQP